MVVSKDGSGRVNQEKDAARVPLSRYALITAVVLIVILLKDLLLQAGTVIGLVFLSFLLAVGLEPAVAWLVRRSMKRSLAVITVCAVVALIAAGMAAIVVVPAVREFGSLVDVIPEQTERLAERLGGDNPIGRYLQEKEVHTNIQKALSDLPGAIGSSIGVVFDVLAGIVGVVFAGFTILALAVYFMFSLPKIINALAVTLGTPERDRVLRKALTQVGGYILGQALISATAGVSAYIFFLIAGLPYPAVLAVAVALLGLIPQVGAFAGATIGIVAALSVGVTIAILTLAFFVVYQLVENYWYAPKVFSKATTLSPLMAFIAALLGGASFGLVGAVAALPIAAAGKVVVSHLLAERVASGTIATHREGIQDEQALSPPTKKPD